MTVAQPIDGPNLRVHFPANNTPQATGYQVELNIGGLLFGGPSHIPGRPKPYRNSADTAFSEDSRRRLARCLG